MIAIHNCVEAVGKSVSDPLLVEIAEGIAVISLNDPKTTNALSIDLLHRLQLELDGIGSRHDVKSVVLRST